MRRENGSWIKSPGHGPHNKTKLMDWLITLAIIGLNIFLWWKGKFSITKRLVLGGLSVVFLYWFNYLRKQ